MKRHKWTLLALVFALALAAGLAGGLFYAWVLDPVEYTGAAPDVLYIEDKYVYLILVGDLYAYEGDLEQAQARLAELDIEPSGLVLAGFIEAYLDGGGRAEDVRNLAWLARDLGASGGIMRVFSAPTPLPVEPTSAAAGAAAATAPLASPTPIPTFRLLEQTALCADPGQPGMLLVWVRDAAGSGLPGIEVVASWATGQESFFTGLRPEMGPGYADLEMSPQIAYDVALAGFRGDVAQGLTAELAPGVCPTDTVSLNWRLIFQQMP